MGISVNVAEVKLGFGNVGFCGGRKTGVPRGKALEQGQEPTTNSSTYDAKTRNRTWATLVGSECSHHCSIPAPFNYF